LVPTARVSYSVILLGMPGGICVKAASYRFAVLWYQTSVSAMMGFLSVFPTLNIGLNALPAIN